MRIVDRKTFLELPEGTLYSKFEPDIFSEFGIKGETIDIDLTSGDFWMVPIEHALAYEDELDYTQIIERAHLHGQSIRMNLESWSRDACYEEQQLFAVWEQSDLEQLLAVVQRAIAVTKT